jgi:hypothetical protein
VKTLHLTALLEAAALAAFLLAAWRLAADIGLAQSFVIREGMFSNWMVWVAAGAGTLYMRFRIEERPQEAAAEPAAIQSAPK